MAFKALLRFGFSAGYGRSGGNRAWALAANMTSFYLGAISIGQSPSASRARAAAARTWAGAVPPIWLRAATEPSSVSTS